MYMVQRKNYMLEYVHSNLFLKLCFGKRGYFPLCFLWFFLVLGGYQKKCENQTRFQVGSQFETLKVSDWVMPFMKLDCRVLYNVRMGL
jgi:hypothetical protein